MDSPKNRFIVQKLVSFLACMLALLFLLKVVSEQKNEVLFSDVGLESAIRDKLNKPDGHLSSADLSKVVRLDASDRNISDLNGIQKLTRLEVIQLRRNRIRDLSPLETLSRLFEIDLRENEVADLQPLGKLTGLRKLNLRENKVSDLTPLSNISSLCYLNLHSNAGIVDITPLQSLVHLKTLILRNVSIREDQALILAELNSLERLNLEDTGLEENAMIQKLISRISMKQGSNDRQERPLVISEIQSSNGKTIADEDGDFSDWIELLNLSGKDVELEGWALSDDPADPFKWKFPPLILENGQHLLVWASGKDRTLNPGVIPLGTLPSPTLAVAAWLEGDDQNLVDVSGQANHGRSSASGSSGGDLWSYCLDFRDGGYVKVEDAPSLKLTGSMTVSFWINPNSFSRRQNPWEKCYGGEGAITLETNGELNFYWGTAGANAEPTQSFSSRRRLPLREWSFVVLIRDLQAMTLSWYINGELTATVGAAFEHATASNRAVRLGRGYAGSFDGMIADPMIFPFAVKYGNLHTNFSLRSHGESLQLTAPDGSVSDSMSPVSIPRDVSYGRRSGDPGRWVYFEKPTPGFANLDRFYDAIADAPIFSHSGGFYEEPFELVLSSTDTDAEIFYTLDGSVPNPQNLGGNTFRYKNVYPENPGDSFGELLSASYQTILYESAILIKNVEEQGPRLGTVAATAERNPHFVLSDPVAQGMVVRAMAVGQGLRPSEVVTHTYFIDSEHLGQNQLASVSLVLSPEDFYDFEQGIYTPGVTFDNWRIANPEQSTLLWQAPSNFFNRGREWEKHAHLEWIDSGCATASFRQAIGLRIHGGGSRSAPAKSLRLYARADYGKSSFEYGVFPRQNFDHYKRLMLRNAGQRRGEMITDALAHQLASHLRIATLDYRPVILFINGEYWGLYNLRERHDPHFFARKYGVNADNVEILPMVFRDDSNPHFNALRSAILARTIVTRADIRELESMLDVGSLIDLFVAQLYFRNGDWINNISCWRVRPMEGSEAIIPYDGRWRWMLYDLDYGFGRKRFADERQNILPDLMKFDLFAKLLESEWFRNRFINRLADQLNTGFLQERVISLVDEMEEGVSEAMPAHIRRWTIPASFERWKFNIEGFRHFARNRCEEVREQIREHFKLGDDWELTVQVSGDPNAHIRINETAIEPITPGVNSSIPFPWTGTYFGGIPVTLTAVPSPGFQFTHWEGLIGTSEDRESPSIVLSGKAALSIHAHFIPDEKRK